MLKYLLLLCWATIFVSADDQKNILNNVNNITDSLNKSNLASHSQLSLATTELPTSAIKEIDKLTPTVTASNETHGKNISTEATTKQTTTTTTTTITTTTIKSTTTVAPTTPVAPTTVVPTTPAPPLPPPSTGKWKVEQNKTFCIIVQMAAQINVSYNIANKTIYKTINIPTNSNVTGFCGKTEQNLTLSWGMQNTTRNNFTLHFVKNGTNKYSLHHLEISLVQDSSTNKSNNNITLVHKTPQFSIALSNSYRCLKEQKLSLSLENENKTIGYLTVSNLQFQAFRSDNTTTFGLAKDCTFDTPDIVPITVGCALAVLVVIVLIAYLVGRRRSQARGYLSM